MAGAIIHQPWQLMKCLMQITVQEMNRNNLTANEKVCRIAFTTAGDTSAYNNVLLIKSICL